MAKKPTNGLPPLVREPEARAAYIALDGRRSVRRVREAFLATGRRAPSESTFDYWRAKRKWVKCAREHDEKVVAAASKKIATTATAQVITRAAQFDTVATESLSKAIKMLAKIKVDNCKAADIRALVEVSERASKMYELLEGRATDRVDNLTRDKMDKIIEEMNQELEEKLASVPVLH
jgi:hypothetical protein